MIRLLVVDDREFISSGMLEMLNLESDSETNLEVVGVADDRFTIQQVALPDVALMDILMPVIDGTEATRIISQGFPKPELAVSTLIKAREGYWLADMPIPQLIQLIRSVARRSSQIRLGLVEQAIDGMVDSKSDTETKQPELAELVPEKIDFTWKTALQAATSLIFQRTGEYLSDREILVLHGAWNNYTYEQIAQAEGYASSYLCKDIGHSLWKNLSTALKVKISKKNFKAALRREWRKYTQAGLSQNRDRLAQLIPTDNIALFEGLIALDSTLYLERYVPLAPQTPIESICYEEILKPGALIRIEGAKWMGKTSLVNKIIEQANLQAQKTVYLDFDAVEWEIIQDPNKLLLWLSTITSHQLDLENEIQNYWSKNTSSCNDNCTAYFENYILTRAKSGLVLALDNIDLLFYSPKIAEVFLGMLSDWHEKAQHNNGFSNLKIVTTQSTVDIPLDTNCFFSDRGMPILLEKFDLCQVKILADFYQLNWNDWETLRLMNAVGGNPYLVRLAMYRTKIRNLTLRH